MWKLTEIIILFILGIIFNNIIICESSSCSSYSTQSTCETNSACSWIYRSSTYYCACASEAPQDVYFIMDSSGSVGTTGWDEVTSFVTSMIDSGVGNTSRIGIEVFSTGAWIHYNLTQTQHPRSIITNVVSGLSYLQGWTYTKQAVSAVVTAYKKYANKGYERLALLITDGIPDPGSKQNPCPLKSSLDAANITLVIVGVTSDFSSSAVSCLVDDSSTQIILVDDFSSFDLVRDYTDSFLCPSTISLTLTEVRVQTDSTTNCQFIELYNSGSTVINFKTNPLKFSGLVSGKLNSSIHANLSSGQYMVLYKSGTSPYCYLCTCTDTNSNHRCDKALYIPCDGKNCSFNSVYNGKTINNTNWVIYVQDGSDNSYKINVSYNKKTWPSITSGYSYELQSLSDDDTVGTNWAQSCTDYGTPGQAPLSPCSACTQSVCQQNGDSGAHCSGTGATSYCNCTETKKYYASGSSCYIVPNVTSCKTLVTKDQDGPYVYISWTDASTTSTHYYYVKYPYADDTIGWATTASGTDFYGYSDGTVSTSSFVPLVATIIPDNTSTLTLNGVKVVYGSWVPCPITTQAPTKAPTPSPTQGVPTIPNCNCTISSSNTVTIKWHTPTYNYPYTPSSVSYYKIYVTCNGVNITYYSTSRVFSGIISSCPSLTTSTLTSVKVAAVVNLTTGIENDVLMRKESTVCTISTAAPTKGPSHAPTKAPTLKPIPGPTRTPTSAPTYQDWKITSCVVTILQGDSAINISYTEEKPSDTSNPRTIVYYDKDTSTSAQLTGNPGTVSISGVSITDTSRFVVYPRFLEYPNGPYIGQSCCNATCSVVTLSPTRAPTPSPTGGPTPSPTHIPTSHPTGPPTTFPTPAPTYYGSLQISNCDYTLYKHNGIMSITFTEATGFSATDTGDTPTLTSSRYIVTENSSILAELAPATAGASYSANISLTWTFDSSDPVYVTVYYEAVKAVGPAVKCTLHTLAPTKTPTQAPSTPSPNYGALSVGFDASSFGTDCSWTSGPEAACTITANAVENLLYVKREPTVFGYDVSYSWAVNITGRRRMLVNLSDFSGTTSGQPLISSSYDTSTIGYTYDGHHNYSVFFTIYISSCWISDSNYDASVFEYTCSLRDPYRVLVTVSSSQKVQVSSHKGSLPSWIWYAIAAGVLGMLLISFLGYRYYKKKQFADQLKETKKVELKEAENLDDVGNFGGVGDDVRFNPLATGGTHDIASGGQYIDQQLDKQKNNHEIAQVDVDTTVFRQDYGQVQVNKRK